MQFKHNNNTVLNTRVLRNNYIKIEPFAIFKNSNRIKYDIRLQRRNKL